MRNVFQMVCLGLYNDAFYSVRINDLSDLKLMNTWALGNCNVFLVKSPRLLRMNSHVRIPRRIGILKNDRGLNDPEKLIYANTRTNELITTFTGLRSVSIRLLC